MLDERMLFEAMRHATQMLALGTTVDIAMFTLAKVVVPTQRGAGRINRNATFEGGRHVRSALLGAEVRTRGSRFRRRWGHSVRSLAFLRVRLRFALIARCAGGSFSGPREQQLFHTTHLQYDRQVPIEREAAVSTQREPSSTLITKPQVHLTVTEGKLSQRDALVPLRGVLVVSIEEELDEGLVYLKGHKLGNGIAHSSTSQGMMHK